jgi:DNA-binding NarL/FixJ family response regulator
VAAKEGSAPDSSVDPKTNPQIAPELYLSQKTVETHIRNLFHKLGASSRLEVARIAEHTQLETPKR